LLVHSFYTFVASEITFMRQFLRFSYCLFFFCFQAQAQSILDQDVVLRQIKAQLPEGWTMELKEKRLILSRNDSVWSKKISRNPKKMNADERIASFKKEGKKVKTMLSFRFEARWSKDALKKAEDQNRKTFNQIAKLPTKYKIEALYDSAGSEKGIDLYLPKTSEDKENVRKFEEERTKLLKSVIAVPFLHTEKFSLFPDAFTGTEDTFTDIYPEQASMEWYKVQNSVTTLCREKAKP
jgi:hypothetical protein